MWTYLNIKQKETHYNLNLHKFSGISEIYLIYMKVFWCLLKLASVDKALNSFYACQ